MTVQTTSKLQQDLNLIRSLISQGGPEEHQYEQVIKWTSKLREKHLNGIYSELDIQLLCKAFGKDFMEHTLQGHGYRKPYGYAGDFEMIDKIYTQHTSTHSKYKKWDIFFHNQAAPQAVRNRKTFFQETLLRILKDKARPVELLNVASGPCRDLMETYEKIDPARLKSTCVDMDPRAIAYAKKLNKDYREHITFIQQNVFKLRLTQQFDLVWSAGLFDYFDDKPFVLVLKNLYRNVKPGGRLIIGNFSENNPSRAYMETMGNWFLHHRPAHHLAYLAQQAGIAPKYIEVQKEALGVNLFLCIDKAARTMSERGRLR
ncbi:MAG: methyltransferase domain-containing protein [Phaeodactylibacter sp.]|nr:methyltransferase domain-containing protein [Phaeodactylibacter sp.]MCB9048093.1 methyltransferase domain-containing protein [Lewinellaceae bacterium]